MVGRPAVLVVLLSALTLLPASVSSNATAPTLDALRLAPAEGGLAVDLDVGGRGGSGTLVVSHRDAHGATVVDRLVPFTVESGASATVEIAGLRAGESFEVRAVAEEAASLLESGAAVVANVTRALALPPLASATLAPVERANHTRAFPAFQTADDRGHEPTARVVVLASGVVVVAYMEILSAPTDTLDRCVIRLATSRDGGRTFSAPWDATAEETSASPERSCAWSHRWAVAAYDDLGVAIVDDVAGDDERARFRIVDAIGWHERAGGSLPFDIDGPVAATPLPLGRVLVATAHGGAISLDTVGMDGRVAKSVTLYAPTWAHLRAATGADGTVAVAWDATGAAYWSVSRDGGRTFSEPREIALPPDTRSQVEISGLEVSREGTLHLGVFNSQTGDAFYARMPAESPATITPLCGPRDGAVLPACSRAQYPTIAAGGGRTWLWFQAFSGEKGWQDKDAVTWRAIESADDGVTFDRPYRLKDHPGTALSTPYDASAFPDGRPIMLGLFFFNGTAQAPAIGVVPAFDPFAAKSLTRATNAVVSDIDFSAAPIATSAPHRVGRLAERVAIVDARVVNAADGEPAGAVVQVHVENLGAFAPAVRVFLEGNGFSTEPILADLEAGATVFVRIPLPALDGGAPFSAIAVAGSSRAEHPLTMPEQEADPEPETGAREDPALAPPSPILAGEPDARATPVPAALVIAAGLLASIRSRARR